MINKKPKTFRVSRTSHWNPSNTLKGVILKQHMCISKMQQWAIMCILPRIIMQACNLWSLFIKPTIMLIKLVLGCIKNYMFVYQVKYVVIKSCMRWWCGTNFIVVSVSLMDVMRLDKKCGTHSFIGKITRYSLAKIMGHFEINFILFIKYKYMYYQEVHKWMEDWFGYII